MARHPLSTMVGVSRARGPTPRMRDRNLHFHPPSDPHSRGLIIPDRYSLIYENGGEAEGGWGIACPLSPLLLAPLRSGGCLSRYRGCGGLAFVGARVTSNGPDGGFRVIAVDDRNNFRPILIPTCLVSTSRFSIFFFSLNFFHSIFWCWKKNINTKVLDAI